MRRIPTTVLVAALLSEAPVAGRAESEVSAPPASSSGAPARQLTTQAKRWTGDFDGMMQRRVIRVLVPNSRTLYFNDRGHELGISAEAVRRFERWLLERHAKELGNRPITVLIIPTARDRLLPDLVEGRGDIAVGNLTVTPERLRVVDFVVDPGVPPVKEIVVTGPASPPIAAVDELAGRTVHVRRTSSYFESLQALNARLANEGKQAVNVVLVPDALEDEDLLEMTDAGILEAVVVDDWKARMWAQVLPRIKVNEHVVTRPDAQIGWAIRPESPKLKAEIAAFMKAEGTKGNVAYLLNKYMRRIKRITNPTEEAARKRFAQLYALFEKYGHEYRFDPLMLTAQGYQESRLDQSARSQVGAIGVMQVMPATGEELAVGDIRRVEPNIHAGTKYLDRLMTRYFAGADLDDENRALFAFASYNAGPGAISKMRKLAEESGLDPNRWFDNVEIVTARRIGIETTTYVRNIYKYYVAYRLLEQTRAMERQAREQAIRDAAP